MDTERYRQKFQCLLLNKMNSDEELDLMLLTMILILKKQKRRKRKSIGKGHLQELQNLRY